MKVLLRILAVPVVLIGAWVFLYLLSQRHPNHSYRFPSSLKTLVSAQADYRANDRDGDGKQAFWRQDVAGLYLLRPSGSPDMIKLIEISVAAADATTSLDLTPIGGRTAKAGYWFKAIRHVDEEPGKLDSRRFAFCAYPATPADGRTMFVTDENSTIFKAPAVPGGVDVFPDEKTLKEKWAKVD